MRRSVAHDRSRRRSGLPPGRGGHGPAERLRYCLEHEADDQVPGSLDHWYSVSIVKVGRRSKRDRVSRYNVHSRALTAARSDEMVACERRAAASFRRMIWRASCADPKSTGRLERRRCNEKRTSRRAHSRVCHRQSRRSTHTPIRSRRRTHAIWRAARAGRRDDRSPGKPGQRRDVGVFAPRALNKGKQESAPSRVHDRQAWLIPGKVRAAANRQHCDGAAPAVSTSSHCR